MNYRKIYPPRVCIIIGAGSLAVAILLFIERGAWRVIYELMPVGLSCLGGWLIFKGSVAIIKERGRLIPSLRKKDMDVSCPHCGYTSQLGKKFCSHCGSALPQPLVCNKCKQINLPEALFCAYCGQRLEHNPGTTQLY